MAVRYNELSQIAASYLQTNQRWTLCSPLLLCSQYWQGRGGPGEIKLQFSLQFISISPSVITTIGVILPFLPTKYFVSSVLSSDRSIITSVSIVSREKDDVFLKVLMDCWMRNFWIIWKQTIYPEYIYADKGLNLNT